MAQTPCFMVYARLFATQVSRFRLLAAIVHN